MALFKILNLFWVLFILQMFFPLRMLNAGHSSDMPLVTWQLLAQDARDGACSGWFGIAHLAEAASTAATLLMCHWHTQARKRWEGASSRGSGAALFTAAFPTSQGWSHSDSCHPQRKTVPKVNSALTGRTHPVTAGDISV